MSLSSRMIVYSGGKERVLVKYDLQSGKLDFLPRFQDEIVMLKQSLYQNFLSIEQRNKSIAFIDQETFQVIAKINNVSICTDNIM